MSMAEFYALVAGLLTLFFAIIGLPLLRGRSRAAEDEVTNVKLVKARLAEMQREVDEGVLSETDFLAAQEEVKLALLDEQQTSEKKQHSMLPALGVGLILSALTGVIVYSQVNHIPGVNALFDAPDNLQVLSEKLLDPEQASSISPQDIQTLALGIRLRLREEPEDAQGWMFLGRLRMTLGQLEESVAAFERSLALRPQNTMTRVSFAQVLMMTNTDEGLRRAQRILQALLAENDNNDNLRLMMAVTSAQLGQNEVALPYYQAVRNKLEPNNPMRLTLDEQLGFNLPTTATDAEPAALKLTISVLPELQDKLPDQGYLLVFVRPDELQSGLPIAVNRGALSRFPVDLVLTDDNAMMPSAKLSDHQHVNVTVRVSQTPDVSAKSGDLEGKLAIVERDQAQVYEILINKVID